MIENRDLVHDNGAGWNRHALIERTAYSAPRGATRYIRSMNLEKLLIPDLRAGYLSSRFAPAEVMTELLERATRAPDRRIWIERFSLAQVLGYVDALQSRSVADLPLYGIPFVIKDNIDLAGVATTAGCPAFSYLPERSASTVEKLLRAGAIPLGKTNLDQFATGLSGTRSPFGACRNSFDDEYIAGGSSAGSAVAVATGLASFALGTDTAGSGRVPAAFNNLIGFKPSLGRLSTMGVVPACRSLDCVSIFALTAPDARQVLDVTEGYDLHDPYSRKLDDRPITGMRFGVPLREQLKFFGDAEYARLFEATTARLEAAGKCKVEIDFAPFLDAARLLYGGPWVAERDAAVGRFITAHAQAVLPLTARIITGAREFSATDAFEGQYRLMTLKRASEAIWQAVDFIVTPTVGTIYSLAAMEANPLELNATLGYYTNSLNLFGLAGVAVPAGFRSDGLPFGVTLIGPDGSDRALLALADSLHRASVRTLGAQQCPMPDFAPEPCTLEDGYLALVVCGAHMQDLPLNHQLRERGAYFLERTHTAPCYRLLALPGGPPYRPGLLRTASGGVAIEIEIWALPSEALGSLILGIPAPLGIAQVELATGVRAAGFICEGYAAAACVDISECGGWREYLKRTA